MPWEHTFAYGTASTVYRAEPVMRNSTTFDPLLQNGSVYVNEYIHKMGQDSWEFCGSIPKDGKDGDEYTLVFKRQTER